MEATITNTTYSDPVWEGEVNFKHQEFVNSAKLWGAVCAIQGTVRPETPLPVLTETIYRNYDKLTTASNKHLDGVLGIEHAKFDIQKLEADNEALEPEAIKKEQQYEIEKHKMGRIEVPKVPYGQIILVSFLGLLILFFDAYFLGTAFQSLGTGLGLSIIIGVAISVTIAVISIFGTRQIERIENKGKRILAYIGLVALVGASIYVLCEMRSWYYHNQTGHEISAFKLMLLNILAFVGFHLIYKHLLVPAFQRLKERRQALQKLMHLKKMKDELDCIKNIISGNLEKIVWIKKFRLAVLSYAKTLEITISKYYREAVAEFKKAFIEKAGYVPNSFQSEAPDLSHYYSDIHVKPQIHENAEH